MGLCRDRTAHGEARQLWAIRRLPGNLRVRENAWWATQLFANRSPLIAGNFAGKFAKQARFETLASGKSDALSMDWSLNSLLKQAGN